VHEAGRLVLSPDGELCVGWALALVTLTGGLLLGSGAVVSRASRRAM